MSRISNNADEPTYTNENGTNNRPIVLQELHSGPEEAQMDTNAESDRISTNTESDRVPSSSDPPEDTYKPSAKGSMLWKLPRVLFNACTNPLQFFDRIPCVSSRAVFARTEFQRRLSEHVDDVGNRAILKYLDKMVDQADGERPNFQFSQPRLLQSLGGIIEEFDFLQTMTFSENPVHELLRDTGDDEDDESPKGNWELLSEIVKALGRERKQILRNAIGDCERAWKSRSAYASVIAGLRGLQDLLDTVDPSFFSQSRALCQKAIWAVEDLKRIRKWKRKEEITLEMQHILVQDWREEEALKDFVAALLEEGQSFIVGSANGLMGYLEHGKDRTTVRRHSI